MNMYPQIEHQGVHLPPNRNMSGHAAGVVLFELKAGHFITVLKQVL